MSSLRILGVRPPSEDLVLEGYSEINESISVTPNNARTPNLGLFYIASILDLELTALGYSPSIELFDMPAQESETVSPLPEGFSTPNIAYADGVIRKRLRGCPLSTLQSKLDKISIVFFSASFTSNAGATAISVATIRQIAPDVLIIVGGRDAQYRPNWYLSQGFDLVFLGQAEGIAGLACHQMLKGKFDDLPSGVTTSHNRKRWSSKNNEKWKEEDLKKNNIYVLKQFKPKLLRDADLRHNILPDFSLLDLSCYDESSDGSFPEGVEGPAMWYRTSVGCPRECSFCVTAQNNYVYMNPHRVEQMLLHYKQFEIRTLLSAEDNFLARLLSINTNAEEEIINICRIIRELEFSHEFTDGLEVGLLMDKKGRIRRKLVHEIFKREIKNEQTYGTHRLFWPIETFTRRGSLSKLRENDDHIKILNAVIDEGIPQIGFGVILFHDISKEEYEDLHRYLDSFRNWMIKHQETTEWRIAIFHELPLPGAKNYSIMESKLAFSIEDHPELWSLPINPVNGIHYTYAELYGLKRNLLSEFDPDLLRTWDSLGKYGLQRK